MPPTWLWAPGPIPHQSSRPPVAEVVPAAGGGAWSPSCSPRTRSKPAAARRRSAARYLSARSSSSGIGSSPRRIRPASRVPSSTIRAYALTWSGAGGERRVEAGLPVGRRLPGRAVDQVEAGVLEPGRLRLGHACCGRPGECTRSRVASTCGTADCMPNDTRVNPASRSAASPAASTDSGLDSVVTSASSASPKTVRDRGEQRAQVGRGEQGRGSAADEDGLPPPAHRGPSTPCGEVDLGEARPPDRRPGSSRAPRPSSAAV